MQSHARIKCETASKTMECAGKAQRRRRFGRNAPPQTGRHGQIRRRQCAIAVSGRFARESREWARMGEVNKCPTYSRFIRVIRGQNLGDVDRKADDAICCRPERPVQKGAASSAPRAIPKFSAYAATEARSIGFTGMRCETMTMSEAISPIWKVSSRSGVSTDSCKSSRKTDSLKAWRTS